MGKAGIWQLYDMATDRTELVDLSASKPAMVKDLAAKWEEWARRSHVIPYPGSAGQGGEKQGKSKTTVGD